MQAGGCVDKRRGRQVTVELFRFLALLQSTLLQFPSFAIHIRNLWEARVTIAAYNDHCSPPSSRAFLVGFSTTKVYSGVGADIVMESITLTTPVWGVVGVMGIRQP